MTIKIVLPYPGERQAKNGIRVYTHKGHEIENISRIEMDFRPNEILEATITVAVSDIENLEGIEGVVIVDRGQEDGDQ